MSIQTSDMDLIEARIPSPVLPLSALTTQFGTFMHWYTAFSGQNLGMTYFDPSILAAVCISQQSASINPYLNLSGNALPSAQVDAILAAIDGADVGSGGSFLDLSGGTNGTPTPAQLRVNGDAVFNIDSVESGSGWIGADGGGDAGTIWLFALLSDLDFGSSYVTGDSLVIGVQDNPAPSDVADWVRSNGGFTGSGTSIEALVINDQYLPLQLGLPGGWSQTSLVSGQPYEPNAALTDLVEKGWTVNTN